ncbi:SepM family pheromone-processing serine protease [Listeria sp. PSOL-1]|uniref:SepM family pheromone-processing serine protease n=1 Tax=Listeria sp. PSOL-1 TaxID=1844999 RepID=UPI0013D3A815|nr:SepM family pheromone-processing serine protease [Listeria sp. PSOL-1]
MHKQTKKIIAIVLLIIIIIGFFIPMPYYITKPGSADALEPLVTVEDHPKTVKGSFSLVTVAMTDANIYSYLAAKFLPYHQIDPKEEVKYDHESDEEYNVRQMYMMNESKNNAIQVAYKAAKQDIKVNYSGIYVLSVLEEAPASKFLTAGDLITAIDGHPFKSSQEFISYVKSKKAGNKIELSYVHNKQKRTANIPLAKIDKKGTVGIGITLVDDQNVSADPKIKIDSDKIGGPSAGLMFSLEIYSRFMKTDLTRGRQVAGTGTIDASGNVGRIGGIDQKVVAADKSGASIFFAPNDEITTEMKKDDPTILSNYQLAKKTAKAIHSKMKIIPVKTFQDAVNYLQK